MKKMCVIYIFLAICILFTTVNCKKNTLPSNIMDTATMAAFLSEAYLVESYDNVVVQQHRDSLSYQTNAAYDSLLAKYGITQAVYDSSLSYYLHHPKTLVEICTRVEQQTKAMMDKKSQSSLQYGKNTGGDSATTPFAKKPALQIQNSAATTK